MTLSYSESGFSLQHSPACAVPPIPQNDPFTLSMERPNMSTSSHSGCCYIPTVTSCCLYVTNNFIQQVLYNH